jgi:hypothetical protein
MNRTNALLKNVQHARRIAALGDVHSLLRRNPPPREEKSVRLAA